MMNERPAIVTTDLSVRSDRAVARGLGLAAQLGAPACVLHVFNASDRKEGAEARAEQLFKEDFGPLPDTVEFVSDWGDPPTVIARMTAQRRAQIVVTGVSQLNEALDLVLGTTVERLVRECPAPILVAKRRATKPYERLLIATDFSECSREALETAAVLFPEAQLRLLNVYRAPFQGFLDRDSTIDFVRSEAKAEMTALEGKLHQSIRARLEVGLEEGDWAGSKIADVASSWRADLVVAGSHGRSGLAHALIGSRAVDILNHVPHDTLVVRPARGPQRPPQAG